VARVWQVDITSPGSESSAHELDDDVLDTVADPLNDTSCSRCAHLCQHPRGNALQPSKQSLRWTLLLHLLWLLALAIALAGHAGLFLQTPATAAHASLGCAYFLLAQRVGYSPDLGTTYSSSNAGATRACSSQSEDCCRQEGTQIVVLSSVQQLAQLLR